MSRKNKSEAQVTRVVAYLRVSTEKQADQGNSLEAQRARLEAYAQVYGLSIVAYETDSGVSASSLERPALQRALARLDAGEADGLLVTKLDRLTRNVADLCSLVTTYFKGEHSLLSVNEQIDTRSAGGRMLLNLLTVVAQWEREVIGERTSAVMQHMRAQGRFTGGWPPYGFREVDGELVPDDHEQEIIARARALRSTGMSLRGIASQLPANRAGTTFDPKQIARMM